MVKWAECYRRRYSQFNRVGQHIFRLVTGGAQFIGNALSGFQLLPLTRRTYEYQLAQPLPDR